MTDETGNVQNQQAEEKPANSGATNEPVLVDGLTAAQWKAKFDGASGTAIQRQRDLNNALAEQKRLENVLAGRETELSAEKQTLEQQLETLKGEKQALLEQNLKFQKAKEIGKIVKEKAPEVFDLFEEGLLDLGGLEGEALEAKLKTAKTAVLKIAGKTETVPDDSGALPPPPKGNQQPEQTTEEEAYKAVDDARLSYGINSPEYRKAMMALTNSLTAKK